MGFWNIRDRFFDLSSDNAYIFKFQQNAFFYFFGFFCCCLFSFCFVLFCLFLRVTLELGKTP